MTGVWLHYDEQCSTESRFLSPIYTYNFATIPFLIDRRYFWAEPKNYMTYFNSRVLPPSSTSSICEMLKLLTTILILHINVLSEIGGAGRIRIVTGTGSRPCSYTNKVKSFGAAVVGIEPYTVCQNKRICIPSVWAFIWESVCNRKHMWQEKNEKIATKWSFTHRRIRYNLHIDTSLLDVVVVCTYTGAGPLAARMVELQESVPHGKRIQNKVPATNTHDA